MANTPQNSAVIIAIPWIYRCCYAGVLQKFQLQLQAKHPTFFATTRLGRNLKDRCTKTDPERDVLNSMLEELRNKWNAVRSVVTKR